jgi:hypothetical protein
MLKRSKTIFMFLIITYATAANNRFGIGGGINLVNTNAQYSPVPSVCINIMNDKSIHEIAGEYTRSANVIDETAIVYSYLRFIHSKYFLLGPSLGLLFSEYQEEYMTQGMFGPEQHYHTKGGIYFFGIKGMMKISSRHFGVNISDRILIGMQYVNKQNSLGLSNLFGAGFFIVL